MPLPSTSVRRMASNELRAPVRGGGAIDGMANDDTSRACALASSSAPRPGGLRDSGRLHRVARFATG